MLNYMLFTHKCTFRFVKQHIGHVPKNKETSSGAVHHLHTLQYRVVGPLHTLQLNFEDSEVR